MRRVWLVSCLVVAVVAARSAAQPEPEPKDGKLVIPLTLTPTAPPKPLSKLHVYPEYRDFQPGTRVQGLLRCFMEQDAFFSNKLAEKRHEQLQLPLAELPSDAVPRQGIAYPEPNTYTPLMGMIDKGARYARVEWNEYFDLRSDGIYMLLPEVQKLRSLAQVVLLRMRCEVKDGQFDRAAASAKTLFGMANALEQHPTLISNLVGIAIAHLAVNGLEEMIAQPGCPNLYWSFSDLPRPLIDIRHGTGGERVFIEAQFAQLLKADRALSGEELGRHITVISELVPMVQEGPRPGGAKAIVAQLGGWAADNTRVAAGRKRLVEQGGLPADAVKAFPPLQVVLTDDLLQYVIERDEVFKWLTLPYPEAAAGVRAAEARLKTLRGELLLAPAAIATAMKVKDAQARTDQRVAYLRVIEAVRLFAHENNGNLPAALADLKVPVPNDPLTGKPFEYTVADGVATLHGANPTPGAERTNRYYELRVR